MGGESARDIGLADRLRDPCGSSQWDAHAVSQLLLSWIIPSTVTVKQSKPELTDSCGQFLTGDVYKKFAKLIPHLYFILFTHMCCTSFA